ncbi:MAG: cytochrome P450, partial [Pseudomonadota bacterium]
LYIGGNETTTFALSSGLWLMLREPSLYQRLLDAPDQIPAFVEEVLRLESPTQGLYRVTTRAVEMHGVDIPKGALVHMRYGAANRDPDEYSCPHAPDLGRKNLKRHMAFSQGPHTCPGADLSRLEQRICFTKLLEQLENLQLAPGKNDFQHLPGFVLRALKALHITYGAKA